MKRNLYLIFALLLLGVAQARAQQIAVTFNDGGMFQFDEYPGDCKITFSNGQMLFHVNGAVKNTIAIKDIQRMVFYAYHASVDDMEIKNSIVYNPVSAELVANVAPGTAIKIYRGHQKQFAPQHQILGAHFWAKTHRTLFAPQTSFCYVL